MIDTLPPDDEEHELEDICNDDKFNAIRLACERKGQIKLIQTAFSVIEKLMASDLLVGDIPVYGDSSTINSPSALSSEPETADSRKIVVKPSKILMDVIVDTIFHSVKGVDDEETQLLAIRCVVACVLSRNRLVHGVSLMTCIRTCYLINKDSKSATAQSTATAALTQMLNTLTVRLDDNMNPSTPVDISGTISEWCESYARKLLNKAVLLSDPDNDTSDDRGRFGWCVVCDKSADYFCRKSRDPVCSMDCKKLNLVRIGLILNMDQRRLKKALNTLTEYHDVLTVIKSLCKLAASGNAPAVPSATVALPDQRVVKSKRLSLELISSVLDSACATYLRQDLGFLTIIKQHLFVSLLTNSVSPVPKIFTIALHIFGQLLGSELKSQLLREIGIFIHQVFIYILESENSSFNHKEHVLEIFNTIFADPKLVSQIFQSFDCSMDEPNVIELSVNSVCKSMNLQVIPNSATSLSPEQIYELKRLAMSAVAALITSMSTWVREELTTAPISAPDDRSDSATTAEEAPGESPAPVAPAVVGAASEGKQRKLLLHGGLELFKNKPSKGIDFLVQNKFIISKDPTDVAKALLDLQGLDKTAVGDFIGENKEFNLSVFYAFVDFMEFASLELDQALRKFLSHFRLPGEAQKIDRIMEKFAAKFVQDNPGRYANADSAYVLSFAVIMLNTDLHSAQIKKKMTIEEFVKLGRGINTEIEISAAELERLYRNIEREAISLSEDDERRAKQDIKSVPPASDDVISQQRRRFEMFMKETEQMIQKSTALVDRRAKSKSQATDANSTPSVGDVRDIVLAGATPILSTISATLEKESLTMPEEEQQKLIQTLVGVINLAIKFDIEQVKREYFECLATIALGWQTTNGAVEFKHTECMISILKLAIENGNGLGSGSWISVVKILSLMDKVALITEWKPDSSQNIQNATSGFSRLVGGAATWLSAPSHATPTQRPVTVYSELERANATIILESVDMMLVDMVLSKSVSLNPVNVLGLISGIVAISWDAELKENPPRLYLCQKLVEMADFNMGRIRIVWSKIWGQISPYLVQLATQSTERTIALFAIDSLRQLAFKFLSKTELGNYHFQTEFLRPFFTIMKSPSATVETHELILSVTNSLIRQVAPNLKSGWISIFMVLGIACESKEEKIVSIATATLRDIDGDASLLSVKSENFREFVNCIASLVDNKTSTEETIKFAWETLSNNIDALANSSAENEGTPKTTQWMCLFKSLFALLLDQRAEIRDRAMDLLFSEILEKRILSLESDTIQIFLRAVLIPFCDDVVHSIGDGAISLETGTGLITSISAGFDCCLDLHFHNVFSKFIFEIFNFNSHFVFFEKSSAVTDVGISNIRKLVINNMATFDAERWDQITDGLIKMLRGTIPQALVVNTNITTLAVLPFNAEHIVNTCTTHLNCIQLVNDIVEAVSDRGSEIAIPMTALERLSQILISSKDFATSFNVQLPLREKLKALGFMRDLRQLPGLLKQERASLSVVLKMLFLVLTAGNTQLKDVEAARKNLSRISSEIVENYVSKEVKLASISVQIRDALIDEIEREINGLVPLISVVIIGGFNKMSSNEFFANRVWIFELCLKLVRANNPGIRSAVVNILESKFAPLINRE